MNYNDKTETSYEELVIEAAEFAVANTLRAIRAIPSISPLEASMILAAVASALGSCGSKHTERVIAAMESIDDATVILVDGV